MRVLRVFMTLISLSIGISCGSGGYGPTGPTPTPTPIPPPNTRIIRISPESGSTVNYNFNLNIAVDASYYYSGTYAGKVVVAAYLATDERNVIPESFNAKSGPDMSGMFTLHPNLPDSYKSSISQTTFVIVRLEHWPTVDNGPDKVILASESRPWILNFR
jgi:hypothetical protein